MFLYGRGGKTNVQCSWLIKGDEDESIRITVNSIKSKKLNCRTVVRPLTDTLDCEREITHGMKLQVSEVPWEGVEVPAACLCSTEVLPYSIKSKGSSLLLNMTILGMGPGDDNNVFNFDVDFEFLPKPKCQGGIRKLEAPAGGVILSPDTDPDECNSRPWLLQAPKGHSFLLTLPKATLANESCSTDSRLILRTPGTTDTLIVVCPSAAHDATIQFVWPPIPGLQNSTSSGHLFYDMEEGIPRLVAQWEPRRSSELTMHWLHLRDPSKVVTTGAYTSSPHSGTKCKEMCEALGACIVSDLWCDGTVHCPDGETYQYADLNALCM